MRALLIERGATFRFDTKVEGFLTRGGGERGAIRGLKLTGGGEILADRCARGNVGTRGFTSLPRYPATPLLPPPGCMCVCVLVRVCVFFFRAFVFA